MDGMRGVRKLSKSKDNKPKRTKSERSTFWLYIILRVFVCVIMLDQLNQRCYDNVFVCILTLIMFMIPTFIEKKFQINLPNTLEIIVLLFIFAAEILGEIKSYYINFPHWDTILHTLNGFLMAAIGMSMIDILNQNKKVQIKLTPVFVALFAFCFSMTIGVMWEFFEFGMDCAFRTDMQKDTILTNVSSVALNEENVNRAIIIDVETTSINNGEIVINGYLDIGIYDTMKDLIVNFVGAVIFSGFGAIYIKNRKRVRFVENFIPTMNVKSKEPIKK